MTRTRRDVALLGLALALLLFPACEGTASAPAAEAVGRAVMRLSVAPVGARCLVVTVSAPPGTEAQAWAFDLLPGELATFTLQGLPLGPRAFSAAAYTEACATRGQGAAGWTSDAVLETVTAEAPVSVALTLTAVATSGSATVQVGFPDPVPAGVVASIPVPGLAPRGLAAGADGNLWVTLRDTPAIARVSLDGGVSQVQLPATTSPAGIVSGPDGNLWFAENRMPPTLGRLTPRGVLTEFGLNCTRPPEHLAVGVRGELWITCVGVDGQLATYDPVSGEQLVYLLPPGAFPSAVTVQADGTVWYGDWVRHVLGKLSPNGVLQEVSLGPPGATPMPVALAAMPDGTVAFADQMDRTIGHLLPDGGIRRVRPGGIGWPTALAVGSDGSLWYTLSSGQVGVEAPDGSLREFALSSAQATPLAVVQGPDGAMWVLESTPGQVDRVVVP